MNWQPIETAPKDNSLILAYAEFAETLDAQDHARVVAPKGSMSIIVFSGTDGCLITNVGEEFSSDGEIVEINDCFHPTYQRLTHWMPLPEPPK